MTGPEVFGSNHICPDCDFAWYGDPTCKLCSKWVPKVSSPTIANPSGPQPDQVGEALIL